MGKERRSFKRYRKRHPANIRTDRGVYQAEVLDYSLSGLRLLFPGGLPLKAGDILRVESRELSVPIPGRVVRTGKGPEGYVVGVLRNDEIKGSLKNYRLADVLNDIRRLLFTGQLKFSLGEAEKTLYVKNGELIFATSSLKHDQVGALLLKEGRIKDREYALTAEVAERSGLRQGAVLVEMCYIRPAELVGAVTRMAEGIIESLFNAGDCEVEFKEGALPVGADITLKLPVGDLIYRGVRKSSVFEEGLLNLPGETLLALSEDPFDRYQEIHFEEDDRRLLALVDGKTTLREIIAHSGLDERQARENVAALLSTAIIDIIEEEGKAPKETAAAGHEEVPAGLKEKIEDLHGRYRDMDYYALFDLTSGSPGPEIKKAFYRLTRELHPDRHFSLPGEMRAKLNEIFSHITYAYKTLTSPEAREKYEESIRAGSGAPASNAEVARGRFKAGVREYENGKYKEAAQLFTHAAYLDGSVAEYHLHEGLALFALGDPKKAEKSMRRAHELEPSDDEILAELGYVYLKLGFALRAQGTFKKALTLDPANRRAKEGLSKANKVTFV